VDIDYSTIARIARCPRAYELDLISQIPAPKSAALYLGSTFHLVQRTYFSSRLANIELTRDDVVDAFNTFWYSMAGADGNPIDWGREKPEEQAELGRAMVKAFYPYAQKIQPLLVEHKFTKDTPYGKVYGTMDLVTVQAEVDDWKTSSRLPYQNDVDSELQPTVYDFLLGGLVPFNYYYILKFKLPVVRIFPTKRYEEDLSFFERSILPGVVKQIQTGLFPPLGKANGACKWCGHNKYCETIYGGQKCQQTMKKKRKPILSLTRQV